VSKECILGLDIGTQSVKGVLTDCAGNILTSTAINRLPQHPKPGWVEMDVERDWWGASLQVIQQLLAQLPPGYQPAAVGLCGLVPCLALIDRRGQSVGPAILYSDNRALKELEWVNKRSGMALTAQAVVPKLVWMQRNQPTAFQKAHKLLSAHNYLVFRLTGTTCMDYDTASIMGGVFDSDQLSWRTDRIQSLDLPVSIWPELRPATATAGMVTQEASCVTGLPAGIPVISGSGDTFPTMLGCGAINPGDAMVAIGTTGLLTLTTQPLQDSLSGPHFTNQGEGGTVIWGANVLSAGRLVTWYRDNFAGLERQLEEQGKTSSLALLEDQARPIPAGAEGLIVLPHLLGRRTPQPDANLRGAFLGLAPHHTSAHLYRAILEAFAYNINQGLIPLREKIQRLVVTGGGARSPLWRQIISDVINMPVQFHSKSSGALGIAFMTAFGLNRVADFQDIQNAWLAEPVIIHPQPHNVQIHQLYFEVYNAFDEAVAAPFAKLAAIENI
jgi:xylulokinase